MSNMADIDFIASRAVAGYFSDFPPQATSLADTWAGLSESQRIHWRSCVRFVLSAIQTTNVLNKAPHHMSVEETELIGLCDEYEKFREQEGRLADAVCELAAFRIAEHFELIRRAIHKA